MRNLHLKVPTTKMIDNCIRQEAIDSLLQLGRSWILLGTRVILMWVCLGVRWYEWLSYDEGVRIVKLMIYHPVTIVKLYKISLAGRCLFWGPHRWRVYLYTVLPTNIHGLNDFMFIWYETFRYREVFKYLPRLSCPVNLIMLLPV